MFSLEGIYVCTYISLHPRLMFYVFPIYSKKQGFQVYICDIKYSHFSYLSFFFEFLYFFIGTLLKRKLRLFMSWQIVILLLSICSESSNTHFFLLQKKHLIFLPYVKIRNVFSRHFLLWTTRLFLHHQVCLLFLIVSIWGFER